MNSRDAILEHRAIHSDGRVCKWRTNKQNKSGGALDWVEREDFERERSRSIVKNVRVKTTRAESAVRAV